MKKEEEREALPVTLKELELIVEALNDYWQKATIKAERFEKKPRKLREHLGFIQETLQFTTLVRNIRTGKLNEAVASSIGMPELPRDEGEETTMS